MIGFIDSPFVSRWENTFARSSRFSVSSLVHHYCVGVVVNSINLDRGE